MKTMKQYSEYARDLASFFPKSANVDMLLFSLGEKPCMRTKIEVKGDVVFLLELWCQRYKNHFRIDHEQYIYIARDLKLLDAVMSLDHSPQEHAAKLGILLGYPECCCRMIDSLGEGGIDRFEETYKFQEFTAPFHIINPVRYREGFAFISHVPCSTSCAASYKIALRVKNLIKQNQELPPFDDFFQWAEKFDDSS